MKRNVHIYRALFLSALILAPVATFAAGGGGHADSGVILKDFLYDFNI